MQNNLKAAVLAALLLAPAAVFAQEAEDASYSANFGIVSDYVFRGVSQSNRDMALQGGVDYSFGDSGFYGGVWGSTVDFAAGSNGPNAEVDLYVGYNADITDNLNFDVMLTRYTYHGAEPVYGNIDYNELITKVALKDVGTLTVGYTNDYGNSGENVTYVNLGNSWDLGGEYTLNAGFGRTFSDVGDYNDWNVGVSKTFDKFEFGLNYYDTNLEGPRAADAVVLSVTIGG